MHFDASVNENGVKMLRRRLDVLVAQPSQFAFWNGSYDRCKEKKHKWALICPLVGSATHSTY